jgi:hypothetical protein
MATLLHKHAVLLTSFGFFTVYYQLLFQIYISFRDLLLGVDQFCDHKFITFL